MKNINSEKGITLTTLIITIIVLMILSFSITASIKSTIETRNYNGVKEDIINLSEEIRVYYLNNGELPIDTSKTYDLKEYGVPDNDINPNDEGNYYRIKTNLLSDVILNNGGLENNEENADTDDMYVVNESSLTVYYLMGAILDGQRHYTIVDDFSGGGFAEDYYSKVDYPVFAVIAEESNNAKDKTIADTGETVTLKMISKYKQSYFTKLPTVKINGEDVSDTLDWNNNVITATYTIPVDSTKLDYGAPVSFEISDYKVEDGENIINGETITKVNFGKIVTRKYVTLVQAFKEGNIKVGDYLNYNDYVDESKTYTTVTNENGWTDQTYTATKNTYWQVLGLDSTGEKLMLISQSPIKKAMKTEDTAEDWEKTPYLVLKGAYGYVNCKTILNNISGIYSTSLGRSKSITAEEINRLIGVTVDYTNKTVYANTDSSTNIDEAKVLGKQYTYKESDYTPESYINNKANATAGTQTDPATAYYYRWSNLTIPDTLKTMLFSGTTANENNAKAYWLASLVDSVYSVLVDSEPNRANFGPGEVIYDIVDSYFGFFDSNGDWYANGLGVRPVVYLNSNITVEDLKIIDGQEDDWSAYSIYVEGFANGDKDNGEAGNYGNLFEIR